VYSNRRITYARGGLIKEGMTMADSMVQMLQDLATKNDLTRSTEMKAIQTLANGIMHCLLRLDGIEKTQKQILDQVG
jgi:hypothetical protein